MVTLLAFGEEKLLFVHRPDLPALPAFGERFSCFVHPARLLLRKYLYGGTIYA